MHFGSLFAELIEASLQSEVRGGAGVDQKTGVTRRGDAGGRRHRTGRALLRGSGSTAARGRAGRRRTSGDALGGSGPFVGRTKRLRWISETVEIHNVPSSAPRDFQ